MHPAVALCTDSLTLSPWLHEIIKAIRDYSFMRKYPVFASPVSSLSIFNSLLDVDSLPAAWVVLVLRLQSCPDLVHLWGNSLAVILPRQTGL